MGMVVKGSAGQVTESWLGKLVLKILGGWSRGLNTDEIRSELYLENYSPDREALLATLNGLVNEGALCRSGVTGVWSLATGTEDKPDTPVKAQPDRTALLDDQLGHVIDSLGPKMTYRSILDALRETVDWVQETDLDLALVRFKRSGRLELDPKSGIWRDLRTPGEQTLSVAESGPKTEYALPSDLLVTAERLQGLLTSDTFKELLEDYYKPLVAALKQEKGHKTSGSKRDLAFALVSIYQYDLLAIPAIRDAVAKAVKLESPAKWHQGSLAAKAFVHSSGFPESLAGKSPDARPDSFTLFPAQSDLAPLADFQQEVSDKVVELLSGKGKKRRCLVTLPTGAGKTRVAVESLVRHISAQKGICRVVWLGPTMELNEQAYRAFYSVLSARARTNPVSLIRLWENDDGEFNTDADFRVSAECYSTITVATPIKFMRRLERLSKRSWSPQSTVERVCQETEILCIDEAHLAGAPTYKKILSLLDEVAPKRGHVARAMGLSATPVRGLRGETQEIKTRELGKLFEEELYYSERLGNPENHRNTLQDLGYLAKLEVNPIITKTRVVLEDFPLEFDSDMEEELLEKEHTVRNLDQEIGQKLDTHVRRMNILPHLEQLARTPGRQIIYFGPTVQDAAFMAFLLARNGIPAGFVSGETKSSTRRRVIQEFNEGKLRVLCNCEVLTAGFDAPKITDVFIARPTLSSVLFEQMVGRGLRGEKFGGTSSCKVHYCEDDFRATGGESIELPILIWRQVLRDWGVGNGAGVPAKPQAPTPIRAPTSVLEMSQGQIDVLVRRVGVPAVLKSMGFEVVDNRSKGGALWVNDHPKFAAVEVKLRQVGIRFRQKTDGDKSAWWTK